MSAAAATATTAVAAVSLSWLNFGGNSSSSAAFLPQMFLPSDEGGKHTKYQKKRETGYYVTHTHTSDVTLHKQK